MHLQKCLTFGVHIKLSKPFVLRELVSNAPLAPSDEEIPLIGQCRQLKKIRKNNAQIRQRKLVQKAN